MGAAPDVMSIKLDKSYFSTSGLLVRKRMIGGTKAAWVIWRRNEPSEFVYSVTFLEEDDTHTRYSDLKPQFPKQKNTVTLSQSGLLVFFAT